MELNIIDKKVKYEEALKCFKVKYSDIKYDASISVLDLNKDIIGFFYDTIEKEYSKEEACLRLYGFMQALFVSIDAIYTLSISLTGSKNFININNNKTLRELKYIRNDVVGHPTNRIVNSKTVYCILRPEDISKYSFKYRIYGLEQEEVREVSFISILFDYYREASNLLNVLINFETAKSSQLFSDDLYFMLKEYKNNHDISTLFKNFRFEYKKLNLTDTRIDRRIMLMSKLHSLKKTKINRFAYLYHLRYLYNIVSKSENINPNNFDITPYPDEIIELEWLVHKNQELENEVHILTNHNNPSFNQILARFINVAQKKNYTKALDFLSQIRSFIKDEKFDLAFAYESLIKEIL